MAETPEQRRKRIAKARKATRTTDAADQGLAQWNQTAPRGGGSGSKK